MAKTDTHIDVMPTKAFFVDMLIRDIPLERAVLDLVDNCIDGAKRLRPGEKPDFSDLSVFIKLDADCFEISDNCGGFDTQTASEYAFRFGRPAKAKSTEYSIGQFGVGMKRALFKFGRYFEVHSMTENESWSMHVDVDDWEDEDKPWQFEFDDVVLGGDFPPEDRGTKIISKKLRPEVSAQFGNEYFRRQLAKAIRNLQREFIGSGLSIFFNDIHLTTSELKIRTGGTFQPAIEEYQFDTDTETPVTVRIVAGVSESVPEEAGWYIICNGRVILYADRTVDTGWGSVAEQKDGIPKYHNQYARFRGIVFFSCRDSRKLPWNTTKTDLDESNPFWQVTLQKMLDHARSVIRFLNAVDQEIDEYGSANAPLRSALYKETHMQSVEEFKGARAFTYNLQPRAPGPKTVKIQYSREETKIRMLMTALGVNSAKAVGEETFDIIFKEQNGSE